MTKHCFDQVLNDEQTLQVQSGLGCWLTDIFEARLGDVSHKKPNLCIVYSARFLLYNIQASRCELLMLLAIQCFLTL